VIPPQIPTGGLIGESVLAHQSYGHILDTTGVQTLGACQVREVDGETPATGEAPVSGEGHDQINGPSGAWVPQIVQRAGIGGVTAGRVIATRTPTRTDVARASVDVRLGEVFGLGNPLGGVRNVFAGSHWHFSTTVPSPC
jgi:hypothetical protein